ncbi:MAG: GspH/FimT family pseudopilin [Gemmatimonadota bacterium]
MTGQRAGFSLMEMLVVLMVIGIVTTIAMPRLDLLSMRVDSMERQVTMTLARAQQLAMLRQHDVHVRFDTAGGALVLHADADNDGEVDGGETESRVELEKGVLFVLEGVPAGPAGAEAISFSRMHGTQPVLTYHRSGSASEAGGFYLGTHRSVAGDEPGDARAVAVDRATGRVRRFNLKAGSWVQS